MVVGGRVDVVTRTSRKEQVVIAGAGPVGMTAALALACRGIPVTVLEAVPSLPTDLRGSTFHPPTFEMLAAVGVADRLIAEGLRVDKFQFRGRSGGIVAEMDMGLLKHDTPFPFRLQCPQHRLTAIILDRLKALDHAEVRFDHMVVGVTQDGEGATAICESGAGTREVRGAYLLGADGAGSNVRKSLEIEFEGMTYPVRYLLLNSTYPFENHFPGLGLVNYIFDPGEWVVLLRVPGIWRILFPVPLSEPEDVAMSEGRVQERLRRLTSTEADFEVSYRHVWRVHQRVATTYRKDRALLLGDAAHINSPIGGMGMNSGIHDAIFLADRLRTVLQDRASDAPLDEYAAVRRGVALEFVRAASHKNTADLEKKEGELWAQRNAEYAGIAADPTLAYEYVRRSSMLTSLKGLQAGRLGGRAEVERCRT